MLAVSVVLVGACSDDDPDGASDVRDAVADQLDVSSDELDVECSNEDVTDCSVMFDDQRIPLGEGEAGPIAQAVILPSVEVEQAITDHATDLGVVVETTDCGDHEKLVLAMADGATCDVTDEAGATGTAVVIADEQGQPVVVELTAG